LSDEKPRPPGVDNSFGGHDPRVIEFENPVERAYWIKALGVSEAELLVALRAVGNSAQKVKDFLRQGT
jgi:uncharacterized protein DUF3606